MQANAPDEESGDEQAKEENIDRMAGRRETQGGLGSLPFRCVMPSPDEQKAEGVKAEGKKRSGQYGLSVKTRLAPKIQAGCQCRQRCS